MSATDPRANNSQPKSFKSLALAFHRLTINCLGLLCDDCMYESKPRKPSNCSKTGFVFVFKRCHWYFFWFVLISRTLAKKTHPKQHTENLHRSEFENCDKCPNILILKWDLSAKKSAVAEMCMSEISDSFTTHLHCELHAGKTENLPT